MYFNRASADLCIRDVWASDLSEGARGGLPRQLRLPPSRGPTATAARGSGDRPERSPGDPDAEIGETHMTLHVYALVRDPTHEKIV